MRSIPKYPRRQRFLSHLPGVKVSRRGPRPHSQSWKPAGQGGGGHTYLSQLQNPRPVPRAGLLSPRVSGGRKITKELWPPLRGRVAWEGHTPAGSRPQECGMCLSQLLCDQVRRCCVISLSHSTTQGTGFSGPLRTFQSRVVLCTWSSLCFQKPGLAVVARGSWKTWVPAGIHKPASGRDLPIGLGISSTGCDSAKPVHVTRF